MKLHLYFVLPLVGFSTAFIPTKPLKIVSGAWSSLNHKIITQAGLWCSVIEFLKTNPKYANQERAAELASVDTARILEGKVSRLFRLVRSSKFQGAVKEIENANAIVDKNEVEKSAAHFDAEQFRESSLRLIDLKKQIISLIKNADDNKVDYTKARKEAGILLHTLQDFYSHSNWIESGNSDPLSILGNEIIREDYIAGADEKTCNDCTPASKVSKRLLGLGFDDCQNNLLNTGKLTSGYYGGQDVAKPQGVGKCSHGGILDKSRKLNSKGGINKDSSLRYLSPHYRQHQPAARVAIKATKVFFDGIREDVGDEKFAKFLNMEALRTLSFAIDTTGSMRDEIAGVQQATVQFIEDAAANDDEDFHYVLVPFNDPDVGPVLTTDDPEVAKQTVNSLRAHDGGDCPEMGMSGLYLALLNSLPNSDVYYFTDAAAKDAHLVFSVTSIALQRKCRIYLFISGQCSSRKRRSLTEREVYEKLASATGGQLIEYSKSNVDEAIKLIRPANISEGNSSLLQEVSLLSVEVNTNNVTTKSYNIQSDSTIASITAVLSAGGNTNIKVVPPQDGNGTINIISQAATFYSVRVIMPTAGVWSFKITAFGPLTFQVTAQSTLAFTTSLEKGEYSSVFEKILVPISGNPIKGTSLYVTVEPTEDALQVNRNIIGYLIDTAGNRLESFELEQGQEFYSNSYYGLVKMKHDAFKIMYFGYSKDGQTIQRLLSRVIRPQEFEVEISVQNNSLSLIPNETTSIIVLLKNHGSSNTFSILVSDDKSFVASFSPKIVTVGSNDSVDIHIDFFAPANTNDSTTTSVSVSASIRSASTVDLANFLSFEVSVFSKEFRFINETEVTSKLNISRFLTPSDDDDSNNESDDGLPTYGIILIIIGSVAILLCPVAVIFKVLNHCRNPVGNV